MSDSGPSARACIANFGVATKLKSASDTAEWQIGTMGYMCPEMLLGKNYSFGCDIWGLGVILHQLLTKTFPFWDNDEQMQQQRVVSDELDLETNPRLAQVSAECKDLLRIMLQKCKE